MSTQLKNILLVSIDTNWCSEVLKQLSNIQGSGVLRSENNLMAAFSMTEELKPDLVVIDDGFTKLPEFEMFKSLLEMLSITTLSITRNNTHHAQDLQKNWCKNDQIIRVEVNRDPSQAASQIQAEFRRCNSKKHRAKARETDAFRTKDPFILIGASTGGVEALTVILSEYPADCPPTLIVQHTGEQFGDGLVSLLDSICPASVVKASGRMPLIYGTIYLAAGGTEHIAFSSEPRPTAIMMPGEKVMGHVPAINVLFHSAVPFSDSCVAGILTGMGKDGVDGLLELRTAGAKTFAQDEQSSVVFGMPKAAWNVGAAEHQVALKDITRHVLDRAKKIELGELDHGI